MHYLHQLLHVFMGVFLFISVFSMQRMMRTGDILDAVGNTHSILIFVHATGIMEVKPRMEVTL